MKKALMEITMQDKEGRTAIAMVKLKNWVPFDAKDVGMKFQPKQLVSFQIYYPNGAFVRWPG